MTGLPSDEKGDRHDPRHPLGLDPDAEDRLVEARRSLTVSLLLDMTDDQLFAALGQALRARSRGEPLTASTGVPRAPVEAPKPAGGATGPTPAAPPVHQPTRRRRGFLLWLLDLIGRPA